MNLLDLLIVVSAVGAAVGGFRLGLVARVTSWMGMAVGLTLAAAVLPTIIDSLEGAEPGTRLIALVGLLLGGAFVGQALGLVVGSKLHLVIPAWYRPVDRAVGSLTGVVGIGVALWVLLPTLADLPGWPAQQARNSAIARWLDSMTPAPPDTLQALRRLVGEQTFPQVFAALQPTPDVGPPPADTGLPAEVIARVTASTFRIEGIACNRVQEGSGFAVAGDLVVTNAHVVSGEDETEVVRDDGSRVSGTVVLFDSDRDLAILRVPGLGRAPLPLDDTEVGGTGGVFGYPGGGPLRLSPFQVSQEVEAVGRDLYDRHETHRQVLILASDLHPGDSGAALVDVDGEVVGVAFAIAPDRPQTAYALAIEELHTVLANDLSQPVDTGPCLR